MVDKIEGTPLQPMSNPQNIVVRSLLCFIAVFAPVRVSAQDAAGAPSGTQPPVAYASVNELNGILSQLQQTAQNIQSDLQKTRIEKWKTDGATKKQTVADVDAIQRNLQATLPDTIAQLNNSPEDLGASFKLYRNLDALYDVFGSVAEMAGAFGSKDEFQNLDNDLNGLKNARRAFAERMQRLTAAKEDELARLRAQVKTLSAAPPPPPKKTVVDDTEPPKKPAKKKVTKPKPATATDTPPSAPPK
jgi:cytochrome c556